MANFGVYNYVIDAQAMSGRWQYMISNLESLDSLSVKVTSKATKDNTEPIWSKCWINTGAQGRKLLSCSQVKSWVKELTWLLYWFFVLRQPVRGYVG